MFISCDENMFFQYSRTCNFVAAVILLCYWDNNNFRHILVLQFKAINATFNYRFI